MNSTERQTLIRLQSRGWLITVVTEDVIMMERPWIKRGILGRCWVWPSGKVTGKSRR